jgi:hypothetical protein
VRLRRYLGNLILTFKMPSRLSLKLLFLFRIYALAADPTPNSTHRPWTFPAGDRDNGDRAIHRRADPCMPLLRSRGRWLASNGRWLRHLPGNVAAVGALQGQQRHLQ